MLSIKAVVIAIFVCSLLEMLGICGICREEHFDFVTRCKHHFHQNCLNQWLMKESFCPYCKNTITSNQKLEELLTNFTGTEEQIKKLDKDTIVSLFESKYYNYPVENVLKRYLQLKGAINKANEKKSTLLHLAVENSNEELVKALLKNGAKLKVKDVHGANPLHIACKNLNLSIVRILIEAGADNKTKDSEGYPPFFYTLDARDHEAKVIKYLLETDSCDLKLKDARGQNCLFYVITNGTLEMFNLLTEKGADPEIMSALGWTLLHEAVVCDKIEILNILLEEFEIFPELPDNEGMTPIILAAKKGSFELVKLLLYYGADPDSKEYGDDMFPLAYAAANNYYEMADLLLSYGKYTINDYPFMDNPPVFQALQKKFFKMAELLISNGANIKLKSKDGSNIVEFLCAKGVFKEGIEFLLKLTELSFDEFMKEYAPDSKQLFFSSFGGDTINNFKTLLEFGLDIKETDSNMNNLLHYACKFKFENVELIDFLIENGLDPLARNKYNETPLSSTIGTPIFKRVLRACPNPIEVKNSHDSFPPIDYALRAAALNSHDTLKALVDHGADVNIAGQGGLTAMHVACLSKDVEMVDILIKAGFKLNGTFKVMDGFPDMYPLGFALIVSNEAVVAKLIEGGASQELLREWASKQRPDEA